MLKICGWNIAGLTKKRLEADFIKFCKGFDCVGLVETWENMEQAQDKVLLEGYAAFRKGKGKKANKGRNPGGIMVLIKEKKGRRIRRLENDLEEVIWVKIEEGKEGFVVGIIYNHPTGSTYHNQNFYEKLEDEILVIMEGNVGASLILIGDFNARIGTMKGEREEGEEEEWEEEDKELGGLNINRDSEDKVVDKEGRKLVGMCKRVGLRILNGRTKGDADGKLTYMSRIGCSVVDYAIAELNGEKKKIDMEVGDRVESDHLPLQVSIFKETKVEGDRLEIGEGENRRTTTRINKYKWKEEKKEDFLKRLEGREAEFYRIGWQEAIESKDVDKGFFILKLMLETVGKDMEIRDSTGTKKGLKGKKGWFDEDCLEEKKKTKALLRGMRKEKEKAERAKKLREYLDQKKVYEEKCEEKRERWGNQWTEDLREIITRNASEEFWRKIRELIGKAPEKKAEISTDSWVSYFENLVGGEEEAVVEDGPGMREEDKHDQEMDREISQEEIRKAAKKMKNNKAAGPDGIPNEFLKQVLANGKIARLMEQFFNVIYEKGQTPKEWGHGMIHTIFKGKGDPTEPGGYRGITLLNSTGKLFGKIMADRIRRRAEREGILIPNQMGFRPKHGTVDSALILRWLAERELKKKGGKLYTSFVDFEKAFDKIDRKLLWEKLSSMGMPTKILNAVKGMYEYTVSSIKITPREITEGIPIRKGVRQGCQLSPVLFVLFMNDLDEWLKEKGTHPPCIGEKEIKILMYADDIVLLSISKIGLQRALDSLGRYSERWRLKVNVNKTKVLIFKKGKKCSKKERFYYQGVELEKVSEFNYLGIIFQFNLKWKRHQEEAVGKARRALMTVRRAIYKFKNFPVKMLVRVVNTMINPILTYGAEVWGDKVNEKIINKVTSGISKEILGVGKQAVTAAAMREVGLRETSYLVEKRWMTYAATLKGKGEEKLLLRSFDRRDGRSDWHEKVREKARNLKLERLFEVDHEIKKKEIKVEITEKIDKERDERLKLELKEKKTLKFFREVTREEGEFYLRLDREARAGLAWIRLGQWMWEGIKTEEGRKCRLCGEKDGLLHLTLQCKEVETERERLKAVLSEFNLVHAVRLRDVELLGELGFFFNKIRRKRGDARRQAQ